MIITLMDLPKTAVLMRILLGSAIFSTATATNFASLAGWWLVLLMCGPLHPLPWPAAPLPSFHTVTATPVLRVEAIGQPTFPNESPMRP